MWACGVMSTGGSKLARTMSIWSGWWVDSQNRLLPQVLQKLRVPWSEERKRISCGSPASSLNCAFGTATQVTKPAPWLRRHIEQWQCAQNMAGGLTANRIAPQKHPPSISDEAIGILLAVQLAQPDRGFLPRGRPGHGGGTLFVEPSLLNSPCCRSVLRCGS